MALPNKKLTDMQAEDTLRKMKGKAQLNDASVLPDDSDGDELGSAAPPMPSSDGAEGDEMGQMKDVLGMIAEKLGIPVPWKAAAKPTTDVVNPADKIAEAAAGGMR